MAKLKWDESGKHVYETGVSHGTLYVQNKNGSYSPGVAWNGLTAVTESPTGGEATAIYADDIKYLNLYSVENFEATIDAYTYPEQFKLCNGEGVEIAGLSIGQQNRRSFGFVYRTVVGNDTLAERYGYKLHILYGLRAAPSEKNYQTQNDSPEAITFSWEITSVPISYPDHKPVSALTIDSTKMNAKDLSVLEDLLFGSEETNPSLKTPAEIADVIMIGFLLDDDNDYITIGEDRIRV